MCGLKLGKEVLTIQKLAVTPCVGVWIETYWVYNDIDVNMSHPAWVCGLKLMEMTDMTDGACHTLRGCVD